MNHNENTSTNLEETKSKKGILQKAFEQAIMAENEFNPIYRIESDGIATRFYVDGVEQQHVKSLSFEHGQYGRPEIKVTYM